jgi:hypothetical protein
MEPTPLTQVMARKAHLRILAQGRESWNQWRKDNVRVRPKLDGVDLREANLEQMSPAASIRASDL